MDTGKLRQGGGPAELWKRLRRAYGEHVGAGEQSVLLAWSSFTTTFALTRALHPG